MKQLIETKQETINANSIATAKLSTIVIGALGSSKTKVKMEDLLPYAIKHHNDALKPSTLNAMKWALKNAQMPAAVIGLIGAELG